MDIRSVVVIGAGTMGSGIAQWFAQQLIPTTLCDSHEDQLGRARQTIHTSWDKLVAKEKINACTAAQMKGLLEFKPWPSTSPTSSLVVEAIIENLMIKKELFTQLNAHYSSETIIASNTSSFPIEQMAEAFPEEQRRRFLGLHFFNPATLMKLVEIIRGPETATHLAQDLYAWFEAKGKEPALCKDSPGFIVNRVARNFYGEALRIVETDDEVKMKEVDRLMREVGGFNMGPFELMDLIGIDVNYAVTCSVWEAYGKLSRFAPHPLQKQMVDEGRFGKKVGRGYYRHG